MPIPRRSNRAVTAHRIALLSALLVAPACVHAQQAPADLSALSLDSLASMEITSVSRHEQKLNEAAAAIYVITHEDIRRSGLATLAEVLRMAPGLDVAQIDSNKWAITTRGFNERFSDRTLFLQDGRTLYSPLTSGVSWDVVQTPLADVDHIEIIRGPGATLWGANAMNGVVNIITKKAQDTRGGLAGGDAAFRSNADGFFRYGHSLGAHGAFRFFTNVVIDSGSPSGSGSSTDGWNDTRAGFRADWQWPSQSTLLMEGEVRTGSVGETTAGIASLTNPLGAPYADRINNAGAHVLARWSKIAGSLESSVQAYADISRRNEVGAIGEYLKVFDMDIDQTYAFVAPHRLSWGVDVRESLDTAFNSFGAAFWPAKRNLQLYSAYLQDEITTRNDTLKFTLGSKLEHSFYNGYVFQPNARAIWTPNSRWSLWASAARAAASPSRTDAEFRYNAAFYTDPSTNQLVLISHFGTMHLPPETVIAAEAGLRVRATSRLSIDLATFHNNYGNFHTDELGTPFLETGQSLPPHLVIPVYVASNDSGRSRGAELLVTAQPTHFWRLSASYTAMLIGIHKTSSSSDNETAGDSAGSTPRHQGQVHSLLTLPRQLEFDTALYYVGKVPSVDVGAYTRLDMRVGWKPSKWLELSAGGRNLFQPTHMEWGTGELVTAQPVGRSAYLKATWSF